jgi:hypothetical protein
LGRRPLNSILAEEKKQLISTAIIAASVHAGQRITDSKAG